MDFGLGIFPTEWTLSPAELGRAAEERGFESLWFTEHTHIPTSRRSPWPGGPVLPREYLHTYDPFVGLAQSAAATTTLRVGTGICLVVERDPVRTAVQGATLDRLSNGRFVFGVGGGWNAEEMENHGTNFKTRFGLLRERTIGIRELWQSGESAFDGRLVHLDSARCEPTPTQRPNPPILMGGDGATTFDRVLEFCDGWMPICRGGQLPPGLHDKVIELRRRAEAAGRDPASINVTVYFAPATEDAIAEMERCEVERAVFLLPCVEPAELMPVIDRYASLVQTTRAR